MTRSKEFFSSDLVPGVGGGGGGGGVKHIENNLGVLTVSKDFTIRQRDSKENVGSIVGINFARASHFFGTFLCRF